MSAASSSSAPTSDVSTAEARAAAWRTLCDWLAANPVDPPQSRLVLPTGTPPEFGAALHRAFTTGVRDSNLNEVNGPLPLVEETTHKADLACWECYNQGHRWTEYQKHSRPAAGSSSRAPKVADPEHYSGDREKFSDFVSQLHLVFNSDPSRYANSNSKLTYAASYLRGAAKRWFTPHLDATTGVCSFANFEAFLAALKAAFDDPDAKVTAERKLRALRQGNDSAATYYSKFMSYAALLDWNEPAKLSYFRLGLKDEIKRLLIGRTMPTTFETFASEIITLDNDLRSYDQEKKPLGQGSGKPAGQQHPKAPQSFSPASGTSTSTGTHPGPMDLSAGRRGKLSPEEKNRRRANNLCLFCGDSGHYASQCPAKTQGKKKISTAKVDPTPSPAPAAGHSAAVLYASAEAKN